MKLTDLAAGGRLPSSRARSAWSPIESLRAYRRRRARRLIDRNARWAEQARNTPALGRSYDRHR